jgi:predicted dehydrogenase
MTTLRIGVLGAARITRIALLRPARALPDVSVDAIAARDEQRASAFASKHGIAKVHGTYDDLLADPDLDAVYLPLPAALHGQWTIAALNAGKHVLVEKPFTANGDEAQAVADAAGGTGLVVMEAFHTLTHPVVGQLRGIVQDGELGALQRATATFCVPIPPGGDIRWNEALGGGALMDVGCYPVRMLQALFGYDATVTSATATTRDGVDASMVATLAFPDLPSATVTASMWSRHVFGARVEIVGDGGTMRAQWPYHPQVGGRIRLRSAAGTRTVDVDRGSTYRYQLEAFRDAVLLGKPPASSLTDSVAMMTVIDEIYRKAGLRPRQPSTASD